MRQRQGTLKEVFSAAKEASLELVDTFLLMIWQVGVASHTEGQFSAPGKFEEVLEQQDDVDTSTLSIPVPLRATSVPLRVTMP